jgi:hypothetical protein
MPHDSLHTVFLAAEILGVHCNVCGHRAVLRAAELASIGLLLGIPTHHGIVLNLKTAKTSGINPYINSVARRRGNRMRRRKTISAIEQASTAGLKRNMG